MSLLAYRSVTQLIKPTGARFFAQDYDRTYNPRRLYPELIKKWRKRKGLAECPNAYGPLTDLPDYTFMDGRRAPLTCGQLERAIKQRGLAEQIIKFTAEMDYAVERDNNAKAELAQERKGIINSKLKPKSRPFGQT